MKIFLHPPTTVLRSTHKSNSTPHNLCILWPHVLILLIKYINKLVKLKQKGYYSVCRTLKQITSYFYLNYSNWRHSEITIMRLKTTKIRLGWFHIFTVKNCFVNSVFNINTRHIWVTRSPSHSIHENLYFLRP